MESLNLEYQLDLAADEDPRVRLRLAQDPALGEAAQRLLASDHDRDVLGALAARADLTPDVQLRLAGTPGAWHAIASNHATTREAQLELIRSTRADAELRTWARHRLAVHTTVLEVQLDLASDRHLAPAKGLAENPAFHPQVQELVAASESAFFRSALAASPYLTSAAAATLVQDEDVNVRTSLTMNPAAPDPVLGAPVWNLDRFPLGAARVDAALEGLDAETSTVLRSRWIGTPDELAQAVGELAAQAQ
jgi:hypothetical protein